MNRHRRMVLQALSLLVVAPAALALPGGLTSLPAEGLSRLTGEQSDLFRQWFSAIIRQQIRQGPSRRWQHRDCAGLVRFAVQESLRNHDQKWLQVSGFDVKHLPPALQLSPAQMALRNTWKIAEGQSGAYVSALGMIQHNSRYIGKNLSQAKTGDLIFFDQGDNQHLMVWLDNLIAYHTGTITPADNGLRAVTIKQLLNWKDTRWRISQHNPNFIGFYRFAFLSR